MDKQYYYIYNFEQARFYINHGLVVEDIGTGNKGDLFFKFKNCPKLQELFTLWRQRLQ